jgi:hypothetical protein
MSLTNVVPYFQGVMNSLGHKEWRDALADDNIPRTLIDRSYHLQLGEASTIKQNQDLIEIMQPVVVKLYVKGYRSTWEGRDKALQFEEAIIRTALSEARRHQAYVGIRNVLFLSGSVAELSTDNDNTMRVTINFNCYLIMASA